MPVVHSEQIAPSKNSEILSSSAQSKLRGITEHELKAWRKAVNDQGNLNYDFLDLHEIFDYPFKVGPTDMLLDKSRIFLGRIMTVFGSTSRKTIDGVRAGWPGGTSALVQPVV